MRFVVDSQIQLVIGKVPHILPYMEVDAVRAAFEIVHLDHNENLVVLGRRSDEM